MENKKEEISPGCFLSIIFVIVIFIAAISSGEAATLFYWLFALPNIALLVVFGKNIVAKNVFWSIRLIPIILFVLSLSTCLGLSIYHGTIDYGHETYKLRQQILDAMGFVSGFMIFSLVAAVITFMVTVFIELKRTAEIKEEIIKNLKTIYQPNLPVSIELSESHLNFDNIPQMTKKYKAAVRKLIKHLDQSRACYSGKRFSKIDITDHSTLNNSIQEIFEFLTPSILTSSDNTYGIKCLRQLMLHDGFLPKKVSPNIYRFDNHIFDYISLFGTTIRKQILEFDEWNESESADLAVYLIVRKNVIDYYAKKYLSEYGYETLEEFCETQSKYNFEYETAHLFTYYYIQKTDISLSITQTHKRILDNGSRLIEQNKERNFEKEIFSSSKNSYSKSDD